MFINEEQVKAIQDAFELTGYQDHVHRPDDKRQIREAIGILDSLSVPVDTADLSEGSLPAYKSHKIVNACKILKFTRKSDGGEYIYPAEEGIEKFAVSSAYVKKHSPKVDGYYVIYEDGYRSWSPKNVFEKAYQPLTAMSFGHAIEALKDGQKVCRAGWNGKGIFIALQVPDENSKMTSPYIFINTTGLETENEQAPKSLVPWLASQTDMLANDWQVVTD